MDVKKEELKHWEKRWGRFPRNATSSFARRSYKLVKNKNFETLLELGPGDGKDTLYFAGKGYKITAADYSNSSLREVNNLGKDNIRTVKQDFTNLDFSNNSFDIIYTRFSLQYFDDKTTTEIFDKLYKILKPGGYIFVSCKSTEDPNYKKGKKIGEGLYICKNRQRHFFDKNYMREKLRKFKVIKVRRNNTVFSKYEAIAIEAVAKK